MAVIPRFIGPDRPERPSVERMRFDDWTLRSAEPDRAAISDALVALTGIVFQCNVEATRQRVAVKRLAQKADGASNQRLSVRLFIGKGRNENDGRVMSTRAQDIVQLDSAHLRHLDV